MKKAGTYTSWAKQDPSWFDYGPRVRHESLCLLEWY